MDSENARSYVQRLTVAIINLEECHANVQTHLNTIIDLVAKLVLDFNG